MGKFKILALGYYDRANLGDEAFKEVIPKFYPGCVFTFLCSDDFYDAKINGTQNINDFDAIICGGGDIINDYFHKKLNKIIWNYSKNIHAFGIGIPYPGLIHEGYLDTFDHIFVRNRTDIRRLQHRLGSQYVHYLPDLTFKLNIPKEEDLISIPHNLDKTKLIKKSNVGIFLIQSIHKYPQIVYALTKFVEWLLKDYNVIFYLFNTSGEELEDDTFISNYMCDILKIDYKNIQVDYTRYTPTQMIGIMSQLDYGVCMRFHSHIFCTIAELPFLSIYTTRKVGQYINEEGYDWTCPIVLDNDCKPVSLDINMCKTKFKNMTMKEKAIKHKLKHIKNIYNNLLDTIQPYHLIKTIHKRPKLLDITDNINVKKIYKDLRASLLEKTGFDAFVEKNPPENPLNDEVSSEIGNQLCMSITNMPSNKYLYGTIDNIKNKPHHLLGMIKYIRDDFVKIYLSGESRLNLSYVHQEEFNGLHRAGWQYVVEYMKIFHKFNGILLDVYVDRTFHWGKYIMIHKGIIPYTSPWLGFIHHTPDEDYTNYNTTKFIKDTYFIKSLPMCKGLITLTKYMAKWVSDNISIHGYDIPVISLYHPTIIPSKKFDIDAFINNPNKKLTNIGAWYRNPFTIHVINTNTNFTKCSLKGKQMDNYFKPDNLVITNEDFEENNKTNKWEYYLIDYITKNCKFLTKFKLKHKNIPEKFILNIDDDSIPDNIYLKNLKKYVKNLINSVKILDFLPNDEYDALLTENVVFLNLINCSAANTIIECLARNTPLIINKLDPIVEYLGEDYPLYYNNISEIPKLLTIEKIKETYFYMKSIDKDILKIEKFINDFKSSELYKNLNNDIIDL